MNNDCGCDNSTPTTGRDLNRVTKHLSTYASLGQSHNGRDLRQEENFLLFRLHLDKNCTKRLGLKLRKELSRSYIEYHSAEYMMLLESDQSSESKIRDRTVFLHPRISSLSPKRGLNIETKGGYPQLTLMGYEATIIEGVESFARLGRRCHSSSVTNGINGCNSRRPWSRQRYNVC